MCHCVRDDEIHQAIMVQVAGAVDQEATLTGRADGPVGLLSGQEPVTALSRVQAHGQGARTTSVCHEDEIGEQVAIDIDEMRATYRVAFHSDARSVAGKVTNLVLHGIMKHAVLEHTHVQQSIAVDVSHTYGSAWWEREDILGGKTTRARSVS